MVFDAVSPGRAGPGRFPIFYAHLIYSTLRAQQQNNKNKKVVNKIMRYYTRSVLFIECA